jgi:putative transposase
MARPIRVEFEGAVYHVTARGNERRDIFRSDADRILFLDTLEECVVSAGLVLHAWCLMPNHYHLIVETPGGRLSRAIGWLQTTYSVRFNRRHRRSGHLFQGRFKAHLLEADEYARALVRYIHLNPVRTKAGGDAGKAEAWDRLSTFVWSSHKDYAGLRKPPQWRSTQWLSFFGASKRAATKEYLRFMRLSLEEPVQAPWKELRAGLVLGGEEFANRIADIIGGKKGQEELYWTRRERGDGLRAQAKVLADGESDKRLQIWLRVRMGRERMIDVARAYGYRDGSAVLQIVKRLEGRASRDRGLQRKIHRWKQIILSSVKS